VSVRTHTRTHTHTDVFTMMEMRTDNDSTEDCPRDCYVVYVGGPGNAQRGTQIKLHTTRIRRKRGEYETSRSVYNERTSLINRLTNSAVPNLPRRADVIIIQLVNKFLPSRNSAWSHCCSHKPAWSARPVREADKHTAICEPTV
jgi:hypothetical protein